MFSLGGGAGGAGLGAGGLGAGGLGAGGLGAGGGGAGGLGAGGLGAGGGGAGAFGVLGVGGRAPPCITRRCMIYNTSTNIVSLFVRKTQYRSNVRTVIITGFDTTLTNSFSTSSIGLDGKYSFIGKSIATSKMINTKLII